MQVKIISDSMTNILERRINEWLDANPNIKNINFHYTCSDEGEETCRHWSVLIEYEVENG